MEQCKLCLGEKPLIGKAHVIPNWMYFGLFDEHHKTAMIDLEEKVPPKRPSTGIYDANVFCQSCDNVVLGSLENYGRKILYRNNGFINFFEAKEITISGGLKSAHLDVDNYASFKLFLISLLWKMHLSNNPFFTQVNLGSIHSERIRSKILNNEKIQESEYEVAILALDKVPDLITRMISTPKQIKQSGNTYYVSLINGLLFMFNVSPHHKMDLITKSSLKENGRMLIPLLEGEMAKLFLDSITKVRVRRRF
jgi:hypothetical protein